MAHRYGRLPHELVPGCEPRTWRALIVDAAVYAAGDQAREKLMADPKAMIFPVWGL